MAFGNIGIALGAGVNELNRQRQLGNEDERLQVMKDAAERTGKFQDAQLADMQRREQQRAAATEVWNKAMPIFQGGWPAAADHLADAYNRDSTDHGHDGYNDGKRIAIDKTDNGVYVSHLNDDGTVAQKSFYTPQQVMNEHLRTVYAQLAAINPEYGQQLGNFVEAQNKELTRQAERQQDQDYRSSRDKVGDQHWDSQFDETKRHTRFEENMSGARLGRSDADRADAEKKANAKADASVAIYRQNNPNATPAELAAVRTGVLSALPKEDSSGADYTSTTDNMGNNVTRTNKRTGTIDIINPRDGKVTTIPGPKAVPPQQAISIPPVDQRKLNQTYDTPKGKMIWRGTGWEPVAN